MERAISMRLMEQGEVLDPAHGTDLADGGEVEVTVTAGDEVQHRFTLDPTVAAHLGGALRWIGRKGMHRRLWMEVGFWRNVASDKAAPVTKKVRALTKKVRGAN